MFHFLSSLFSPLRRRRNPSAIFRYWDGTRDRYCDPLIAFQALAAHPEFDLANTPIEADRGDPDAIRAMVKACCDAFSVTQWSEEHPGGLTQMECIGLMVDFTNYLLAVKKNINLPLISREPTGPKSWQEQLAGDQERSEQARESTTSDSLASG